jgi:hypothetical protein
MADAVSAIPSHTLPRNKPLATLLRVKLGFFSGQTGGAEWEIGVSAWNESTYADVPRHLTIEKLFDFDHFSLLFSDYHEVRGCLDDGFEGNHGVWQLYLGGLIRLSTLIWLTTAYKRFST